MANKYMTKCSTSFVMEETHQNDTDFISPQAEWLSSRKQQDVARCGGGAGTLDTVGGM
jgi:hypothetical protein